MFIQYIYIIPPIIPIKDTKHYIFSSDRIRLKEIESFDNHLKLKIDEINIIKREKKEYSNASSKLVK